MTVTASFAVQRQKIEKIIEEGFSFKDQQTNP
jgi:hypothetical protein